MYKSIQQNEAFTFGAVVFDYFFKCDYLFKNTNQNTEPDEGEFYKDKAESRKDKRRKRHKNVASNTARKRYKEEEREDYLQTNNSSVPCDSDGRQHPEKRNNQQQNKAKKSKILKKVARRKRGNKHGKCDEFGVQEISILIDHRCSDIEDLASVNSADQSISTSGSGISLQSHVYDLYDLEDVLSSKGTSRSHIDRSSSARSAALADSSSRSDDLASRPMPPDSIAQESKESLMNNDTSANEMPLLELISNIYNVIERQAGEALENAVPEAGLISKEFANELTVQDDQTERKSATLKIPSLMRLMRIGLNRKKNSRQLKTFDRKGDGQAKTKLCIKSNRTFVACYPKAQRVERVEEGGNPSW